MRACEGLKSQCACSRQWSGKEVNERETDRHAGEAGKKSQVQNSKTSNHKTVLLSYLIWLFDEVQSKHYFKLFQIVTIEEALKHSV